MSDKTPTAPFSMVRPGSPEQASLEEAGWTVTDFVDGWAHMEPAPRAPIEPAWFHRKGDSTFRMTADGDLELTDKTGTVWEISSEAEYIRDALDAHEAMPGALESLSDSNAAYKNASRERNAYRREAREHERSEREFIALLADSQAEANKNGNAAQLWRFVADEVHKLDHRNEGRTDGIRMHDDDVLPVVIRVLNNALRKAKPTEETPNMELLAKVAAASEKAGVTGWLVSQNLSGCEWHITDGPGGEASDGIDALRRILGVLEERIAEQTEQSSLIIEDAKSTILDWEENYTAEQWAEIQRWVARDMS